MSTSMKSVIFILCLFYPEMALKSQTNWKLISPDPQRLGAYTAVSIGNRSYFWTSSNLVYVTSDGGNSFTVSQYTPFDDVALSPYVRQSLAFSDSLTGFVADAAYGQFKTTDGGETWFKVIDKGYLEGEIMFFGSKNIGWRFGGYGFYKTHDGGNTWNYTSIQGWNNDEGSTGRGVAIDEQSIWITKSYIDYFGKGGAIWHSSNGGTSWEKLSSAPMTMDTADVRYMDISMTKDGIGCAVGTSTKHNATIFNGFISTTADSGKTWTTTYYPNEIPTAIVYAGNNSWAMLASNTDTNVYRRSTDNGISWTLRPKISNYTQGYYNHSYVATYCENLNCLFVVMGDGIYRSFDHGETFEQCPTKMDTYVSYFAKEKKHSGSGPPVLVAYGAGTSYLMSFDDGYSWQKKSIPSSVGSGLYLWRISVANGTMYFMINQMLLYKSSDWGDTWKFVQTPNQGGQQGLEAYDSNVVAMNGYPYMLSTTDGGTTWKKSAFPGYCWVNQIEMSDPDHFVAVGTYADTSGERGIFYSTSDAGYNWHIIDLPEQIYQMEKTSSTTMYARGYRGIYKSNNGGNTWNKIRSSTDYYKPFWQMIFRDSLYGLLNEAYYFKTTQDGGNTWEGSAIVNPIAGGIEAFEKTKDGRLMVAGGGYFYIQKVAANEWKTKAITSEIVSSVDGHITMGNYPNPFNPTTTISFTLPTASYVSLTIFDALGREVTTLVDEKLSAGNYSRQWNASAMASGIYFYRIQAGTFTETKKLVVLR